MPTLRQNRNKLAKELLEINRRSGNVKGIFTNKENFVLAAGVLYTIFYVLLLVYMTSGTFGIQQLSITLHPKHSSTSEGNAKLPMNHGY